MAPAPRCGGFFAFRASSLLTPVPSWAQYVGVSSTPLLTTAQVAAMIGVNRRTVLRMVARGELVPFMRTEGGAYLFRADDTVDGAA